MFFHHENNNEHYIHPDSTRDSRSSQKHTHTHTHTHIHTLGTTLFSPLDNIDKHNIDASRHRINGQPENRCLVVLLYLVAVCEIPRDTTRFVTRFVYTILLAYICIPLDHLSHRRCILWGFIYSPWEGGQRSRSWPAFGQGMVCGLSA